MRALHALALLPLGLTLACGGEEFTALQDSDGGGVGGSAGSATTGGGGSTGSGGSRDAGSQAGSGGTGGGVDAGRIKNSGDCDSPADCPHNDPCVDISSGGYRACVSKVPEATACSSPPGNCCNTSDCAAAGQAGKCILGPALPTCGGLVQVPTNVCAADKCKTAADCAETNAICVPAGVFGRKVASCMTGSCRRDSDCTEVKGGACLPIAGPCCPGPIGFFCVYPGGCVNPGDCPGGHCETSTGKAVCAPGGVACVTAL